MLAQRRLAPRLWQLAPLALTATACLTLATLAQPGQPAPAPAAGQPEAPQPRPRSGQPRGEPTSVEAAMKGINRGMKALKPLIESPGAPEDALKILWAIEKDALLAKSMDPIHIKGGKTPENFAAYRKGQIELLGMLLKLETEIMDAKHDDAKATFAAIIAYKDKAHDQFQDE